MKIFVGVLFCTVLGISAHCYASDYVVIKCDTENVNCPALPVPPSAPIPPAPAMPPLPSSLPEIVVPTQAHLACVGKAIGTEIRWDYKNKSSMTGVCNERNGKPYLKLSHIFISN